ncbi:hypothetical protein BpOF4_20824 (plasmid) [Alkalihalophilus pseudofirmus OF4]|uniref:DNA methylase adenine-specific domain-containing protein n=1 Tax=Alkalihalophilus pseudofirmus (strain ATCC BAA-2126 / JCM 17055 / OF4) TaxID=398511 RepID=D3G1D4_ALKPO|nr:hypothetical protein [Alkalihalophilus pseudofirmus]ADC52160.1 hypothetical protein BpOF4_20824 [Alkalihalophilus pseudofirmus OF4]
MTHTFKQSDFERMTYTLLHPLSTKPPQSFEDSFEFGWLRGVAFQGESLLIGRWSKWLSIIDRGELLESDIIPSISFGEGIIKPVQKMLDECLEIIYQDGRRMEQLLDWIGYSLGIGWFEKPSLSNKAWRRLYETFNINLFWEYPCDVLSQFTQMNGVGGVLDYFPTPMTVTKAMNLMISPKRTDSVYEPCLGAAAMLLPTNSLNLTGTELNLTLIKASCIQAFLYLPWLLYCPVPIMNLHANKEEQRMEKFFVFNSDTRIFCGDSLMGEFVAPEKIFQKSEERVDVFIRPYDLRKNEAIQYQDQLENWSNLDRETRFKIVAAQSKEFGFDVTLSNPPFSVKLGKEYKDRIIKLDKSNEEFLKTFQVKQPQIEDILQETLSKKQYVQTSLF